MRGCMLIFPLGPISLNIFALFLASVSDFALIPRRCHLRTETRSEGWKHGCAKRNQLAEQENKSESWE